MTGKEHKILLVDDEKKFLDTMSERVRLKGFEPLTAQSGQEALDIAKKEAVYAAVVDLKMPDMDGLVTITKLKEIQPEVKTVLLTGFGDEKTREAAEAMDAAYFEKDAMGGFWEFLRGMGQKKLNILLVDDEKKFLDTISDRIRLKGFEPLLATSGKEALEVARKEKVYAAVVDLKMPDMDGLVTITKLKEIQPGIWTVLLTGFGDEKVQEAAEALDAAYFEKDAMGGFWNFMKRLQKNLENSMVDATMAGYTDQKPKSGKKGGND
ncbi:MAG: response regulator [Thermodesulfobacteriota bacterium]|nr:response regulator [Thermodesulfobacteriota bacterium]